jgi:hypothetical protein
MWAALRSEGAYRLLLVVLVGLTFVPVARFELILERIAAPLQGLARWTRPLTRALASSEPADDNQQGLDEARQSRQFVASLFASALPAEEFASGRRLVPAAVLARGASERDRLIVRPWTLEGLAIGQPVVHREAYVGRVVAIDRERGVATVELITAREFRVGARLLPPESLRALAQDDPGVALTVGGVALGPRREGEPLTWLSAHDPSRARGIFAELPLEGPLLVHEWLSELDPYAALAEGFGLGRLLPAGQQQDRRVEPLLDFLHGLYHLTILTPPDSSLAEPEPPPHPLADADWVRARSWAPGEPQRWRRTLQLDVGRREGVLLGSAVVHGARLVGRVCALQGSSAEVALIDDPGLSLPVAAAFPDEPERAPRVLGRMTALGRDPETGLPLLHWRDALPLELPGIPSGQPVRLRLFTGTGEIGLPAGLLLGESYVRTGQSGGAGQRLTLTDVFAAHQTGEFLWVRRPGSAERHSLERAP